VIAKVKAVAPFSGIVEAPKLCVIEGGETAVMLAVAVLPAPPSLEVTAPVVLTSVPAVVAFTLTLKVQDPLAAKVAAVKLTEVDPAAAVIAPPPQVPVRPLGVATTRPEGKASVNATPLSA